VLLLLMMMVLLLLLLVMLILLVLQHAPLHVLLLRIPRLERRVCVHAAASAHAAHPWRIPPSIVVVHFTDSKFQTPKNRPQTKISGRKI